MVKKLLILYSTLVFADSNIVGKNQTSVNFSDNSYFIDSKVQKGNNLFFTFDKFDLEKNQKAIFNDKDIQNSIARIDSKAESFIDGELQSSSEHLFLINPNGFIFGENAKLNLFGSLTISSADYLKFSDGTKIYSKPLESEVLSTSSPKSFGFLDSSKFALVSIEGKGEITPDILRDEDRRFNITPNESLNIISGDITIKNGSYIYAKPQDRVIEVRLATIKATNANINLISAKSEGEFDIETKESSFSKLGDISLENRAHIQLGDARQDNGAKSSEFYSLSDNFFMDNSSIPNATNYSNDSKTQINAKNIVLNSSNLLGTAFGEGKATNITLNADSLTLKGENLNTGFRYKGSFINTQTTNTGDGGDITINAKTINLQDEARIDSLTAGGPEQNTDLGDAGDIYINCEELNLDNSAILSVSFLSGGGDVSINAEKMIDLKDSKILTSVYEKDSNGGDINIKNPKYVILNGSSVKANTFEGKGGDISFKSNYFINSSDSLIEAKAISNRGVDGEINNKSTTVDLSEVITPKKLSLNQNEYKIAKCENRDLANRISIYRKENSILRYDDLLPSRINYE